MVLLQGRHRLFFILLPGKRKMNSQLLGSSSAQVLLGMHYITRGAAADNSSFREMGGEGEEENAVMVHFGGTKH